MDITFAKDEILLKSDSIRVNSVLKPVPLKGSIPELNNIKKEYFDKRHRKMIKLTFRNGNFLMKDNPTWVKLSTLVEDARRFYESSKIGSRNPKEGHRIKTYKTAADFILEFASDPKIRYYKFLANRQAMDRESIITIEEFIGESIETSILFQLHTVKDNILLIWENVNDSRASILFAVLR